MDSLTCLVVKSSNGKFASENCKLNDLGEKMEMVAISILCRKVSCLARTDWTLYYRLVMCEMSEQWDPSNLITLTDANRGIDRKSKHIEIKYNFSTNLWKTGKVHFKYYLAN